MRCHKLLTLAATAVLVPAVGAACATGRRSEPNPLLLSVLQSIARTPRSVATFDLRFAAGLRDGMTQWEYRSRADSAVRADVFIRSFATRPTNDTTFVRAWADKLLAETRSDAKQPSDSLTAFVERSDMTYEASGAPATGHRLRTALVLDGALQGVHLYAVLVDHRLIAVRGSHPKERDAAREVDEFVVALVREAGGWEAEGLAAPAALVPSKEIGGYDLIDTRRYPTASAGIQYRYRDSTGADADVYVYTGGIEEFKGDDLAALKSEVANFREMLPIGRQRGYYNDYSIRSDTMLTVRLGEKDRPLHRIQMAMTREHQPQDSYFYLAVVRGHFVKFRMTQPRDTYPVARADRFVHAVLANLEGS